MVIDNSSLYRYDPDVPLVVPEVNPTPFMDYHKKKHHREPELFDRANGCGAEAAARPRNDQTCCCVHVPIRVRCRGKDGADELWDQTKSIYNPTDDKPPKTFTKQIAFNVIPHIDVFMDSGETKEEWKMVAETKKIVDKKHQSHATCVRVPVFVGHSEAINIEFEEFLDEDEARDILREAPGIMVIDKREDGGYVTPIECVGDYATFISRIRQDSTIDNGLNLWCVSDNLRKGAALNAVQIAETLGTRVLKKG